MLSSQRSASVGVILDNEVIGRQTTHPASISRTLDNIDCLIACGRNNLFLASVTLAKCDHGFASTI